MKIMGILDRGFALPSIWSVMQFIFCIPFAICNILGVLFNPTSKPVNLIWISIYYSLIFLNWLLLLYLVKKKENNKEEIMYKRKTEQRTDR